VGILKSLAGMAQERRARFYSDAREDGKLLYAQKFSFILQANSVALEEGPRGRGRRGDFIHLYESPTRALRATAGGAA